MFADASHFFRRLIPELPSVYCDSMAHFTHQWYLYREWNFDPLWVQLEWQKTEFDVSCLIYNKTITHVVWALLFDAEKQPPVSLHLYHVVVTLVPYHAKPLYGLLAQDPHTNILGKGYLIQFQNYSRSCNGFTKQDSALLVVYTWFIWFLDLILHCFMMSFYCLCLLASC